MRRKTPNQELHYLGQMLTATDATDLYRVNAICERAMRIATESNQGNEHPDSEG